MELGKGLRAALATLALGFGLATLAHSPPHGAARAVAMDDGCAPSPMDHAGAYEEPASWFGLWDGNDYRNPFTLGPVEEGITTRFGTASQSVFRSGRAQVTIRLDDAYGWDRARTFKVVARALAMVPGPLLQRIPPMNLDLTQFRDNPEFHAGAAYTWGGRCWVFPEHAECEEPLVVVPRFLERSLSLRSGCIHAASC